MSCRRCLSMAAVVLIAGCGNPPGIYPVSGKVTCRGNPAAGARVVFHRRGGKPLYEQTMMGVVGKDGSFTLDCGSLGQGAPPGEYVVLVDWKYDEAQRPPRSPAEAAARPDRLNGRYCDPNHPLLSAVVRPEANRLPPFDLTDQ